MYTVGLPDWKKIGWHVGKRLKDILNPPKDTGPSREERRAQRLQDGLKGFAYFDDFDEIEAWTQQSVDPIQVSNTPLIKRSAPGVHDQRGPSTSVLLCHDYNGGYHDYESVRPPKLANKLFSCNYLQHVDTFVYFSHKLVCVPPPTWSNSLHRNGVKVLGTFLIERHTPQIERMLEQENGEFTVAKQLARMADAYGFDGWLLNVEGEFSVHTKDYLERLTGFISSLKCLLRPASKTVWYDALTCDNEVDYQNSLTPKNLAYALAADALFTNYKWTVAKVEEARKIAIEEGLEISNILFGVDVWAQNTKMSGPPRVTFPSKGGGGTNTGVALSVLADRGFSTAIFGPGWTHEHFSTASPSGSSDAESVQRSMWEGWPLPAELGCDCGQRMPHHTSLYQANPVLAYAREYPVGSATYFETDFRSAFEREGIEGRIAFRSTLGSQGVSPRCIPMTASEWQTASTQPTTRVMYGELTHTPPQGLMIQTKLLGKPREPQGSNTDLPAEQDSRLCLFKLNMSADGSLEAHIVHKGSAEFVQAEVGIYCAYKETFSDVLKYHQSPIKSRNYDVTDTVIALYSEHPDVRLVELGFYCSGLLAISQPTTLRQILNVNIKPKGQTKAKSGAYDIVNLHVLERGHPEHRQKRLVWGLRERAERGSRPVAGLPWSKTTGPFSYFIVSSHERELGRAYCTEFCLREGDFGEADQNDQNTEAEVTVRGVLFGGGEVSSDPVKISLN